jgi:lysozyme
MLSRHRVSRVALELIKKFEGYRQKAAQLPDGRWTIGYGHTLTAREGAEVSETDAEALLVYDLISIGHAVNENALAPIGQNQFDALCCFAFNIGPDNFRRSQVLKRNAPGRAGGLRHGVVAQGRLRGRADRRRPWSAARRRRPCS